MRKLLLTLLFLPALVYAVDCQITPQCEDNMDNDGDGLCDFDGASGEPGCSGTPDPGCDFANDNDESNATLPQCSDGQDNDSDGQTDFPADPGCTDANDNDETDPPPAAQCEDAIDNDGDLLIDFPADPGCTSATDNDETNTPAGQLGFINRSGSFMTGSTEASDSFGRVFFEDDGVLTLIDSSHRAPLEHPVWQWNGSQFIQDTTLTAQFSGDLIWGWGLEALDVDGDGDLDVVARTSEGVDGWLRNDAGVGNFTFIVSSDWHDCSDLDDPYFYDANGDGVYDPGDSAECISTGIFFDSDNSGTPNNVSNPPDSANWYCYDENRKITYLDLENDGDIDMFCHNPNLGATDTDPDKIVNAAFIAINNGSGSFTYQRVADPIYNLTGDGLGKTPRNAVDIDNNGFADPITGSTESGDIFWLNNGNYTFTQRKLEDLDDEPANIYGGRNPVAVWDWDGDGDLDIAKKAPSLPYNLLMGENTVGGNSMTVEAEAWDKITVRRNSDNQIVFHYEYIQKHSYIQMWGYVHVGLGSLTPSQVTCMRDPVGSAPPVACTPK